MNTLYDGDNLDVLRRHIADASVDLVYLDPPFNSDRNYNVLFRNREGGLPAAQIQAFEDTWTWDDAAVDAFEDVVAAGGNLSNTMQAFRTMLGGCDLLAYLSMMAPRVVELRRVLKATGSLYLHCDPTASHYLKMLLDAIFRPEQFQNEIGQRTVPKGLMSRRLPSNHDLILAYRKTESGTWNSSAVFQPYDPEDLDPKTEDKYSQMDEDGRHYQLTSLLNPNTDRPNLTYEFLGVTRVWRWTKERMQKAYDDGLIVQSSAGSPPRFKRYLDEQRGMPLGDVWTDIPPVNSQAAERLGYPTQKPIALLERILSLSSKEGDVVLDPFCGCGTAIDAAHALKRQWIGIDVTHLAIGLIRSRLQDRYTETVRETYKVVGEPTDLDGARELAVTDPTRHQFEHWALGLVGARSSAKGRGADRGIDGELIFQEGSRGSVFRKVIVSVKSGGAERRDIGDLISVVDREKAALGVMLTLAEPTKPMRNDAASAGFYTSPWGRHRKIQILTIKELLEGGRIDMPPIRQVDRTLPKAPRHQARAAEVATNSVVAATARSGLPDYLAHRRKSPAKKPRKKQ